MALMTMVDALNSALRLEMERDSSIIVLGEDVGEDGGVFRVTDGLFQKFGDSRCISTPLAEAGIVGASIGLALSGLKPVAEIQFDGFLAGAHDQLITHAARMRNRTRGRLSAHIVVRVPYGGGVRALEHHSDSPEAYYTHAPGLKVVIPATPYDAKGLLTAAIRDPDPVVFFEPKKIYRAFKQEVPEEPYVVEIGKARVVQEGNDVSIFAYGAMLHNSVEAAKLASQRGWSVEVIDLRTLSPLDVDAIVSSVKKTGRAVVVHEAPRTCGVGAELAALISERDVLQLEAPVERVTGYDTIVPFARLESHYMPSAQRIFSGIEKVMSF